MDYNKTNMNIDHPNNTVTNVIDVYSKCINVMTDQIDKYKNNEYMLQRIYSHIVLYLPTTLGNEFQNHEKRVNRTNYLINEQQTFIQVFLFFWLRLACF
jgi:predicted nucleic acid-binding protein